MVCLTEVMNLSFTSFVVMLLHLVNNFVHVLMVHFNFSHGYFHFNYHECQAPLFFKGGRM